MAQTRDDESLNTALGMKGNALAETDLIKIWNLSGRKGREKNDSVDSSIVKQGRGYRTQNRLWREDIRSAGLDTLAVKVHRTSRQR